MASTIELVRVRVSSPAGDAILDDLSLTIGAGEAVALIGRSGAGKTTTLRLINGLTRPSAGDVLIDGVPLARTNLITLRRRTGYIIQGTGLFPHRTVYDNVATVPRLLGWPEGKIRASAEETLARVGLPFERFGARYPRSLSGGEQQRVGIVRAIISEPSILLCDEPFGALDPIVRRDLQDVFMEFRRNVTVVFVTHDLAEALRVAQRVILFDDGRIVADAPASRFVREPLPLVQQFVASATLPAGTA
ncbi:MAG TPA: ATP-binding cassette domain-containing protein [Thermoanaerobaculia bacterium]|jgi:osmoprotectant transport system ATP-binding protein